MRIVAGMIVALFGFVSPTFCQTEADDLLAQLSKIRLDKTQIRHVRDITLRRDALSIALNRGLIAFFEPVRGKVTGAVFIGSGEAVLLPPDAMEKQQLFKFTGLPALNEEFQSAVLHFTDGTAEEIKSEILQHAEEDVTDEDSAQFDSWEQAVSRQSKLLDFRLLADFLETPSRPFFLAELNGEKLGWFDVMVDPRMVEEVTVFKNRDLWTSFNQRSEARNPEAVAHEDKSPVEILKDNLDADIRLKGRIDGARVLTFEVSRVLRISGVSSERGEAVAFYQPSDADIVTIVLPQPLRTAQELALKLVYTGPANADRRLGLPSHYKSAEIGVAAASYHDEWLIEGLSRYMAAMNAHLDQALADARSQAIENDNAGAIWLGQRLASTITPTGARGVPNKGLWVIHMLRALLGENMLRDFVKAYSGKSVSTWDFKHFAEKYMTEAADLRRDKKLDWFFDEWVFETGIPKYALDYKVESDGNAYVASGTIKQSGVPDGFMMPVTIFADDEFLGRVLVNDPESEFRFRVTKKPERLIIDPRSDVLTSASAQ